ncbi:MAG: SpoIIE family protein phosphatase [Firmicutes bacterium]|nr:SpoIIE family protein phosphatase [Bacillota bacterium]
MKISAYGLSTTGKELNLDNMYINGRYVTIGSDTQSTISKVTSENLQIYGVADSEISSEDRQLGVQSGYTVMDMLQRIQRALGDMGKIEKGLIWDSMIQASRAIRGKRQEVGMNYLGTSFAALFLHGNRGLAVHLGDSRIYVIRGGRMLQITDDHLQSSDMFRLGILSQAQSEIHKKESQLTAYMGMDDIYEARDSAFSKYFIFYPGDTFIICSDGISDVVMNDEMERIVRLLKSAPVDQLASMLLKAAAEKSTDDMTLVVLHVDEAPGQNQQAAPRTATGAVPRTEAAAQPAPDGEAAAVAAPAFNRQDFQAEPQAQPQRPQLVSTRTQQPLEEDEEEDVDGTSFMDKVKNFKGFAAVKNLFSKKAGDEEDEEDEDEDDYPVTPAAPRGPQAPGQEDYEYEEGEEDEPSLLDGLLSNPKRLAIFAGIAVAAIVLLVVIISLISKGGAKGKGKDAEASAASSQLVEVESSIDITSLLNNESSLVSLEESSIKTGDDEESQKEITEVIDYTIEEGDSWSAIIQKFYGEFDMDLIYMLCEYNDMAIDDMIWPGMIIKIPPESDLR